MSSRAFDLSRGLRLMVSTLPPEMARRTLAWKSAETLENQQKIIYELIRAVDKLHAPDSLKEIIGSYGDALSDDEVFRRLVAWSEEDRECSQESTT